MLSKSRWAVPIVLVLALVVPAMGIAAYTPPHLYECGPKDPNAADPPPQPDLPPEVEAKMQEAIASEDFHPLCSAGEVPQPTKTTESPKMIPPPPNTIEADQAGAQKAQGAQASRVRLGGRKRYPHRGRKASISTRQSHGTSFWGSSKTSTRTCSSRPSTAANFGATPAKRAVIGFRAAAWLFRI